MQVKVAGRPPEREKVLKCRRLRIREKLLTLLFGEKDQMAILLPGRSISQIDIREMGNQTGEGGHEPC